MLHLSIACVCCFVMCCDVGCGIDKNLIVRTEEKQPSIVVEEHIQETTVAQTEVETEVYIPETTVAQTEVYIPETTATPTTVAQVPRGFKYYTVAGQSISKDLQRYLYDRLEHFGIAWYYPYAVCQIWQESRWNPMSTNGRDHGICQMKGIYWDGRAANAGLPGADIWDPYAQLHVFSWMMSGYLNAAGGNTGRALSMYFLGSDQWSDTYVNNVMSWMPTLQEVWE